MELHVPIKPHCNLQDPWRTRKLIAVPMYCSYHWAKPRNSFLLKSLLLWNTTIQNYQLLEKIGILKEKFRNYPPWLLRKLSGCWASLREIGLSFSFDLLSVLLKTHTHTHRDKQTKNPAATLISIERNSFFYRLIQCVKQFPSSSKTHLRQADKMFH